MSVCKSGQDAYEAIAAKNLFELQTFVKIEYGSQSKAKITERSQIHFVCNRCYIKILHSRLYIHGSR